VGQRKIQAEEKSTHEKALGIFQRRGLDALAGYLARRQKMAP
jgi:hypothetical protein